MTDSEASVTAPPTPCQWCGATDGGHSEVCEGFNVNDPAVTVPAHPMSGYGLRDKARMRSRSIRVHWTRRLRRAWRWVAR